MYITLVKSRQNCKVDYLNTIHITSILIHFSKVELEITQVRPDLLLARNKLFIGKLELQ